ASSITTNNALSTLTFYSGALNPNTTYFVRVGSLFGGTTSYAPTSPISTSTLTSPLNNVQPYQVTATSFTVNWTAFTAGSGPNTAEGYEMDVSPDPNFFGSNTFMAV